MKITLSQLPRAVFGFAVLLSLILGGGNVFAQIKKAKNPTLKQRYSAKNSKNKITRKKRELTVPRPEASRENEEEFEGNAEARKEWFMSQRTYPFNELPIDARRKAWESRPADSDAGDSPSALIWQPIGPKPTTSGFPSNWGLTSGRINSIAVAPNNSNLILVGAATGGIWRSTDGGANFAATSDSQVDLAVGSIVFAPSNPSIVYAGMGDTAGGYYGTGVLKSTDSGATWTRISNATLPAPGAVVRVEVDPTNANRVYVAQYAYRSGASTFASGFFYSTDGGVSWTKTVSGLPRDLVRHPTQPNTLYLAMSRNDSVSPNTGGVFKSVDGGVTWARVYTSPFASVSNIKVAVTAAAASNLYVLVGSGSTAQMEVSTNEGASWTNKGSNFDTGQFGYNCYLFVNPTNVNTIYVGTRDMWRSTDGGTTYTNITNNFTLAGGYTPSSSRAHPDQHHFYISPTASAIYVANDGGVWRSTDNAATFQSLNNTLGLTMFVSIDLHPTNAAITYGGTQDNGTQRRTSGQSWQEFISGDGGQTVIDAVDPTIVFTTYVYHQIYRFTANGGSYNGEGGNSAAFNSDRVAFYPPFTGNEVNSTLYFGTYRLYTSANRGASWTAPGGATDLTNGGVLSTIGVSRTNNNVIYTGATDGRVMVSTNGGVNWTDRTTGLPTRTVKSIIVSSTDPNKAYLTLSGYGSGHVYVTTNAGATWTNISGNLPDVPANTLLIDPRSGQSSTIYVGTDVGVFRSTTDGTTWTTFNTGMPPTIVTELDAQAGGLMQAATYGRGMYEINLNDTSVKSRADFDGDGKTDYSVFRNGDWYIQKSTGGNVGANWGAPTDQILPGDYDGDGKADFAVYRANSTTGTNFYQIQSSTLTYRGANWGTAGDIGRAGDFDGDGKDDLAVYRPSTSSFYALPTSGGTPIILQYGIAGDIPVVFNYDGDAKTDFAIFRPSSGIWAIRKSSDLTNITVQFGQNGDQPVPADFDNDNKEDIAVFRNGSWYALRSTNGQPLSVAWGAAGDIPVPGDYDGDGQDDFAVFRAGNWYVLRSTGGSTSAAWGTTGDIPIPKGYIP